MRRIILTQLSYRFLLIVACCIAIRNLSAEEPEKPKLPSFEKIVSETEIISKKFDNYQAGDMITRADVEKLFTLYSKLGWDVVNKNLYLKSVPAEDEFLIKVLRTDKGRPFMRQIAKYKTGYDCADQLSRLPDGQQLLRKLVEGPDGHKMIEYMCNQEGGKNMATMLNQTSAKIDFKKPTGRIYTLKKLLTELVPVYEQAAATAR